MSSIVDRALTSLKKQLKSISTLVVAGLESGAYMYPVQGILYSASHPGLFKPLYRRIHVLLGVSITIVTAMFTLTYVPQAFVLQFVAGPWAWISTVALVLSESSVLIGVAWGFIDGGRVSREVFDRTLEAQGEKGLVARGAGNDGESFAREKKGLIDSLTSSIMMLPLNFIPVVGTLVFLGAQGKKAGPTYHNRYFQKKGLGYKEKGEWVRKREPEYFAFGVAARLLEMVPVVGILFSATNTVGAALWAARMESRETKAQ